MASKISVVINTLNEETNLPRVIASVKSLADEIIVVDMESDDATVSVAKKLGARVFSHKRMGYVEPTRNFAISKATGDWILILDADEEITPDLSKIIKDKIENGKVDYYRVPRKNIIFGKWLKHSRWWPDYNIRLFKKGHVSWNEVIHAVPMTQGEGGELSMEEDMAIIHYHYETVEQYLERLNRYTSVQASVKVKEGYDFSWKDLIVKPSGEFFSRYFAGEGYKDGLHGLALSLLQAFSEFVLYLKIWQADKFKESDVSVKETIKEMKHVGKDLNYWQSDALFKSTGRLIYRIRRLLKI